MSKKLLVAVYDKKIGLFDPPVPVRHIGEAIRMFADIKKNPDTKFGMHPEDFDLFQIGVYDEPSGTVENLQPHIHLESGV